MSLDKFKTSMKRFEILFGLIRIPVDFIACFLASFLVYYVRFHPEKLFLSVYYPKYELSAQDFIKIELLILPFWILIFAFFGLYSLKSNEKLSREILGVINAVSVGIFGVILIVFMFPAKVLSSRFIILGSWISCIIFVIIFRILIRRLQRFLFATGIGFQRIALIESQGKQEKVLEEEINANPYLGYQISFRLKDTESLKYLLKKIKNISKKNLDEVWYLGSKLPKKKILLLIDFCEENKLGFRFAPSLLETRTSWMEMEVIGSVSIIELKKTPLEGWRRFYKRIFDIIVSLVALILFSPAMLVIALLIKLDDKKGPVIYKNEREGAKGKFFLYKFRRMKLEYCTGEEYGGERAEEFEKKLIKKTYKRKGPLYKIYPDPRNTKIGNFLEKTSLDELPQLFNVLIGNMSFVGPRPHQLREVARYKDYYKRILSIKPGITGLAQISGRSDLDSEEEIKLDTFYMENWSMILDLQILLKTPFRMFGRKKT